MKSKNLVARARAYEWEEDASPAEGLLSVLIDLCLAPGAIVDLTPDTLDHAWDKLTRDLSVPDWRDESQALAEGIEVLTANLLEAGREELAEQLRAVGDIRFEAAAHSPEAEEERLLRAHDSAQAGDSRLWVPRRSPSPAGHSR